MEESCASPDREPRSPTPCCLNELEFVLLIEGCGNRFVVSFGSGEMEGLMAMHHSKWSVPPTSMRCQIILLKTSLGEGEANCLHAVDCQLKRESIE